MKRKILLLLLAAALLVSGSCTGHAESYPFRYQSQTGDYGSVMYYDDSLFDRPAFEYSPSLATASLSFAMASFASSDDVDYTEKSKNAADLLGRMGFTGIAPNGFFREKPGTDSLGCIFARKEIGGREMIACGIRGANYGAEWASNVTVGAGTPGDYHQGFYEGSEIFLQSLKDYIASEGISGEIRLWIVGYSRAGAVCNISAGRIDEALRDGVKLFGEDVDLSPDGVYAYCFEAPRGVPRDDSMYPKSELFGNIFCIVNFNDLVAAVLEDFSLTRYGVEKVLYDRVNDIHYSRDIRKMEGFFGSLENSSALGGYIVGDFTPDRFMNGKRSAATLYRNGSQGIYLRRLLRQLTACGLKTRENYAETIQPGLRDILGFLFANGSPRVSVLDLGLAVVRMAEFTDSTDLLLEDLLHNPRKFPVDFKVVLNLAFESMEVDTGTDTIVRSVESLLKAVADMVLQDPDDTLLLPLVSADNASRIVQAHQPELILAFMRSMDPLYTDDPVGYDLDGRYYEAEISDLSADVRVLQDGTEIVRFEDGLPADTGSSVPCGAQQGLHIYLPYGCEYTILSSSDEIRIRVFEPSADNFRDCEYSVLEDGGVYRIVPGL